MINLISTVQGVLQDAGFETRLLELNRSPVVSFEDEALMGFVYVFQSPDLLVNGWRAIETSLLRRYAPSLREAGEKAWNVYSVFLCGNPADDITARRIRWIEEDLDRTRKLATSDVGSREDIVHALLPILPLQYQPTLAIEDLTERLKRQIRAIAPKAADVALDDDVPPMDVVRLLGDSQ